MVELRILKIGLGTLYKLAETVHQNVVFLLFFGQTNEYLLECLIVRFVGPRLVVIPGVQFDLTGLSIEIRFCDVEVEVFPGLDLLERRPRTDPARARSGPAGVCNLETPFAEERCRCVNRTRTAENGERLELRVPAPGLPEAFLPLPISYYNSDHCAWHLAPQIMSMEASGAPGAAVA